jgi:hypothetical protein
MFCHKCFVRKYLVINVPEFPPHAWEFFDSQERSKRSIVARPGPTRKVYAMRTALLSSALVAAALLTTPSFAQQQNAAFCLKDQAGAMKCQFQTMAACESQKGTGTCVPNPQSSTTGMGSPSSPQPTSPSPQR